MYVDGGWFIRVMADPVLTSEIFPVRTRYRRL